MGFRGEICECSRDSCMRLSPEPQGTDFRKSRGFRAKPLQSARLAPRGQQLPLRSSVPDRRGFFTSAALQNNVAKGQNFFPETGADRVVATRLSGLLPARRLWLDLLPEPSFRILITSAMASGFRVAP